MSASRTGTGARAIGSLSPLAAAVAFWALVTVEGLGGPAAAGERLTAGAIALAFLATRRALGAQAEEDRGGVWAPPLIALASLALLVVTPPPTAGLVLALGMRVLLTRELSTLGDALLVGALVATSIGVVPGLDAAGTAVATRLARAVFPIALFHPEGAGAAPLVLGPSAAHLGAAAWAVLCALSRAREGPRWPALLSAAAITLVVVSQWHVAGLLHRELSAFAPHRHVYQFFADADVTAPLLALAVGLGWSRRPADRAAAPRAPLALAGGAALGLTALLPLAGWRLDSEPARSLAVLNVGGIHWDRPVLGTDDMGMFGALPDYLVQAGWSVDVVGLDQVAGGEVDAQVLTIVNCHHVWAAQERAAVEDFVRRGGSLLVLGDHTNVFGLMDGLNSLIGPWGIELRFDSAVKEVLDWEPVSRWDPWPLGLWNDPGGAGIGVGASLQVRAPARSVLRGRWGFSDIGIEENVQGAFLGDYDYEPGERLGDVDLVAARRIGRGIVLVYGDTSGFQNSALKRTVADHVLPVLERLARPGGHLYAPIVQWTLLGLLAAGVGLLLGRRGAGRSLLVGEAGGLAVACIAAAALPVEPPRAAGPRPVLVVEHAHMPQVGHYQAHWNWTSPLTYGALRAGFQIEDRDGVDWSALRPEDVVALIGPQVRLEEAEVDAMVAWLARGGTVIVAASGEAAPEVAPLLERFGLAIEPYTLGRVPPQEQQRPDQPRFVAASPLRLSERARVEELYRYGDDLLAAAVRVGAGEDGGHLLVIGDTRYFNVDNVEGLWGLWPGNVRWIADLLVDYAGGELVEGVLRFPEAEQP